MRPIKPSCGKGLGAFITLNAFPRVRSAYSMSPQLVKGSRERQKKEDRRKTALDFKTALVLQTLTLVSVKF